MVHGGGDHHPSGGNHHSSNNGGNRSHGHGGGSHHHRRHPTWTPTSNQPNGRMWQGHNNHTNNRHYRYDRNVHHVSTDDTYNVSSPHRQSEDCSDCAGCCGCWAVLCCCFGTARMCGLKTGIWLAVSFVTWGMLWVFATTYPEGTEVAFTLNVGETWQIVPPPLWSRTSFGIQSATQDPGLEVYAIAPILSGQQANCPSTTESNQRLIDKQTITMQGGEYQYDYFHLNAKSVINLELLQRQGSTNIYLLRGLAVLKSLEKDDASGSDTFLNFRRRSILKRYSRNGGITTINYEVQQADFYIVVYDNVSATYTTTNKLDVHIQVDVATHYLHNLRPICTADVTVSECFWELDNPEDRQRVESSCIIVKAVSSSSSTTSSTSPTTDAPNINAMDPSQEVMVRLTGTIGSQQFMTVALIPLLVGLGWLMWETACGWQAQTGRGGSIFLNPNTNPTSSEVKPLFATPAATNPDYQATAPPPGTPSPIPIARAILVEEREGYSFDVPIMTDGVVPLPPPTFQ